MCLYVSSEVVLANLLSKKNGATSEEISSYCKQLREALNEHGHDRAVYINVNEQEIDHALSKYCKEFRLFQGRYFMNDGVNIARFNARFDDEVIGTFSNLELAIN